MRAVLLLLALTAIVMALRWYLRLPLESQRRIVLSFSGLALIALAATGRLPWVFGAVGALLPVLAGVLRARSRAGGGPAGVAAPGAQSVVETRFLRMTLDHESGEMAGDVLSGRFAGQPLDALSQRQLLSLLDDYEDGDAESAALLRAYLDRVFGPEWQEARPASPDASGLSGDMTREQAFAILGLEEGASDEDIVAAHGRLIQRLHPDRGGSTFLAAKINQARDLLLDG